MKTKQFIKRAVWLLMPLLSLYASPLWGTETFTANVETGTKSVEKGCITISVTDGTFSRTDNYRCYANESMTISSSHSITKVEITCTDSGTSSYGPGKFSKSSGTSGTYSYSGKVGTWSYASGATSITLNASAQVRMTQIVVTYTVTAPTALEKGTIC